MEGKILEIPCSSAFQLPEDLFDIAPTSPLPENLHSQNSLITRVHTLIEDIRLCREALESSFELNFSRLTISPDSQAPYFLGCPAAVDGIASSESVALPLGHNPQFAQTSNASSDRPFVFPGVSGSGPHHDIDRFHESRDFSNGGSENCGYSILHGQKPVSINNFSNLPLNQSNHHLYQHELTPKIMREGIVSLAKDPIWSSILSSTLEEGLSEEDINMVLAEVTEFSADLMRNRVGSNFIQKLFKACKEDQKTRFIMSLTKYPFKFITLCLNSKGAIEIQQLLAKLTTPQQIRLVVYAITPAAFLLSTNPNGQLVIDFCVKNFSEEYVKPLLDVVTGNCYQIAINKIGCRLLQSCVGRSHGEAGQCLINEIIANAVHLAGHPYGNYVVQHLIMMKIPSINADLVRGFQGCFVWFSSDKFASHVVERLLQYSEEIQCSQIVLEIVQSPSGSMLLLDKYGNFVIQSALSVSKGFVHGALLKLIEVNAASMQSNLYGKRILSWFEKRRGRFTMRTD